MYAAYHICGSGASVLKRYKLAATIASGVLAKGAPAASGGNLIPTTTTDATECYGLAIDGGTYTVVQGATEGTAMVDIRPDLGVGARMSGTAAEGGSLTVLTNTAASATGVTCTSGDVLAADMDGGLMWCIAGANVGLSRTITTYTASTLVTCTVPFPRAIAVGDQFLTTPFGYGDGAASGGDGGIAVTTTTAFLEADCTAASGAGLTCGVVEVYLNGAANSYVVFKVHDHVFGETSFI